MREVIAGCLAILGIGLTVGVLAIGGKIVADEVIDIHKQNEIEIAETSENEFNRFRDNIITGEDVIKTLGYLDKRPYIILISRLDNENDSQTQLHFKNYNIAANASVELNEDKTCWIYKGKVDKNSYYDYEELTDSQSEYYIKEKSIFKSRVIVDSNENIVGIVFEELASE